MQENEITILSSLAEDRLIDKKGNLIKKQKGGPAQYLKNVFLKEDIGFNIYGKPNVFDVEILITKDGEFGKINTKVKPISLDFSAIKTPFAVISTVLDEYKLDNINQFSGKVFLDVQGYVRNGKDFGKKRNGNPART